jgi:membrane fusion protein (multidrug efflux system)
MDAMAQGTENGLKIYLQIIAMLVVTTSLVALANVVLAQFPGFLGQPVTVEIDALGGREFAAHVDSVQAGSGAQFSLLPPENATGNFVKVIQRVPVKILFTEPPDSALPLGPGMSVVPTVHTR